MPSELEQVSPVTVQGSEPSFVQTVNVDGTPAETDSASAAATSPLAALLKPQNLLVAVLILAAVIYLWNRYGRKGKG